MTAVSHSPLVAEDLIAAKSSLQGELRWEFCAPITVLWPERRGDGLLLLQLPPLLAAELPVEAAAMLMAAPLPVLFPDPFVGYGGKYPPGEGSPSGPKPGLRLNTRSGGLHL